ncbi:MULTISPECIES: hypothetical protein [Paenibacillus]|uniref:hypothetical protein n=1 Tax=Paenibacillus TaxID=44249 RepID=UPI000FDCA4F5|nr:MULTISPECIES: hypothetical protein [Paenibacillus]
MSQKPKAAPRSGSQKPKAAPGSGRRKQAASASAATGKGGRPGNVRKPRIANPQPQLNTAEVQGLFNPFAGGAATGGLGAAAGGESGFGFMSLFNRVGGLDGIISTMGKVQKVITIMKQIGPVFKLIGGFGGFGGLGGGSVKTASLRRPQASKPSVKRSSAPPGRRPGGSARR